jgi:hypothetical protein
LNVLLPGALAANWLSPEGTTTSRWTAAIRPFNGADTGGGSGGIEPAHPASTKTATVTTTVRIGILNPPCLAVQRGDAK